MAPPRHMAIDHLEASLDEVVNLLAEAIKFLDLDIAAIFQTNSLAMIDLHRLSERAARWAGNPDRFEEWARLAKADREMRANGPARIASALASGGLDPNNALLEIETAFAEACWKKPSPRIPSLQASMATSRTRWLRDSSASRRDHARPQRVAFGRGTGRRSPAAPKGAWA